MSVELEQLTLPFDFWEEERIAEEKRRKEALESLPHFETPKNDNEYLLECQWKYRHGDTSQLVKMYDRSRLVCLKFINAISQKNRHIKALTLEQKRIKAEDAATYMIEQYIEREEFAVVKNFPGYLYLRVLHELYYMREVDKIVDFVDIQALRKEGCEDKYWDILEEGECLLGTRDIIQYAYAGESESEEGQEQRELKQFLKWKKKNKEVKCTTGTGC